MSPAISKQSFTSYFAAWRAIKSNERCSTLEAMQAAQDRYPELYKKFLEECPRRRR